ncbi:MAG: Gfo/Idh/MocA family oxidoreductase [Planctomycetia bacterium]|nr:Gfo/Idh/MocA family oxidoreductase [Planctomycetia bacterium]
MTLKTNRRDFLKATAVVGTGVIITSDLLAKESPNEKIAFAAVGIGGKGISDLADAAKAGEIVALCDTNKKQLQGGKIRFSEAKQYEDYRQMFEELGDKIDAFTVSTADHMHGVIAAMGMKMGKHCFCQKPLTRTIYEARRLGEIAREMKVITQMGNQGSAESGLRETAAMLRAGILGEVKEVIVWSNRPVWPQGGTRKAPETPPAHLNWDAWLGMAPKRPYASGQYDPFNWRGWWDFGSGALGDMACHTVNMAYAGLDLRNPTWVQAKTSGHNYDSLPKWSIINFDFPGNDWRPSIKFTWMDGGQRPDASLLEGDKPGGSGCLLIGTKGKLYSKDDYGRDKKFYGIPEDEIQNCREKIDFVRSPGHFVEFAEAIKANDPTKCWSNFPDYAAPLTETILLGNLAVWGASKSEELGPRVEWNAKDLTITNNPEDKARLESLVTPTFHNGYEKF